MEKEVSIIIGTSITKIGCVIGKCFYSKPNVPFTFCTIIGNIIGCFCKLVYFFRNKDFVV